MYAPLSWFFLTNLQYYGELGVSSARVIRFPESGKSRGFAYVEFNTADGLEKALTSNGAVSRKLQTAKKKRREK